MKYSSAQDQKRIIHCGRCLSKLRVPVDKGKIYVTCPVCRKVFVYHPSSIPERLKQLGLSLISKMPRDRKRQMLMYIGLFVVFLLISFLRFI